MLPNVRRTLWWIALSGLAVGAYATLSAPGGGAPETTPTQTSTAPAPAASSRCPQSTLEDNGVCVPVPASSGAARASGSEDFIPKLPGRPQSLDAYRLPALAKARLVEAPVRAAELPEIGTIPHLMLTPPAGLPVTHSLETPANAKFDKLCVLSQSAEAHWVLVAESYEGDSQKITLLVLYTGLEVAEGVLDSCDGTGGGAKQPSTTQPAGNPLVLGQTRAQPLRVAVKQLRPGKDLMTGVDAWAAAQSVGVDIRNQLTLQK